MALIFPDNRLNGRQIPDLMSNRLAVSSVKRLATSATMIRETVNDLAALLDRDQRSDIALVPFLSALFAFFLVRRLLALGFGVRMLRAWGERRISGRKSFNFLFEFANSLFIAFHNRFNECTRGFGLGRQFQSLRFP